VTTAPEYSSSLDARRRARELAELRAGAVVDVLVIGGGVTGAGVALDAASRGLSVALAEKVDLAYGTSRWSSKLVHGGLRYLATGDIGVARESAVERGRLIETIAPHLVRALPNITPLLPGISRKDAVLLRGAHLVGDGLRKVAGTRRAIFPRPRRMGPGEVLVYAPTTRRAGLRGGVVFWDGQLVDDARLVVAIARTAASYGARVITRCAADEVTGTGARLTDTLTGESFGVNARAVINATGVWAEDVAPDISLRPSRGTHLVFSQRTFGGLRASLTFPALGYRNRYVLAMPAPENRVYLGLTDVEQAKPFPDVPQASEDEIDYLLSGINNALDIKVNRRDVLGTFTGLRPLLNTGGEHTSDLSRRHAVHRSPNGLVTVVGGKLTTYRRMAEDAVDALGLGVGPSRTSTIPLVGARGGEVIDEHVPAGLARHLRARYGTEAAAVLAAGGDDPTLLEPVAPGLETIGAELVFALRHEGALDAEDLLDRRTRVGLVAADRERVQPLAEKLVADQGRHS